MVGKECNYHPYYISKYEINIIRTAFRNPGSYGSICWEIFQGQNAYTGPRGGKISNVEPIYGTFLKNDINFH